MADPTLIDLVRELRQTVGLFDGAIAATPKEAWAEAIEQVRGLREGRCASCMDKELWAVHRPLGDGA